MHWPSSSDHVVTSTEGGVAIDNGAFGQTSGVLFGLVNLTGSNSAGEGLVGNSIWNWGAWYTSGDNVVSGEGADSINNEGLIQTAFNSESEEITSFTVDNFYNDQPTSGTGILSMIDGNPGDTVEINGNFNGSTGESGVSYLAVDTNFAQWDVPNSEGTDQLHVDGLVSGSTGVIINKVNTEASGAPIGASMLLVTDNNESFSCYDQWCKDGDPFFVASASSSYINVGGTGFVKDGLLMWGISQTEGGAPDDEYSLVSTASPDTDNQALLQSSILGASLDTGGVVDDHSYGNVFPLPPKVGGKGGGGADLSEPIAPTIVNNSSGKSSVLWGRAVGSWTDRDATVTSTALDVDTNANTSTYALQAGLEMRPNADGDGVRLGLYGGYLSTNTTFDTFGGSSSGSGGTVGGYAALINGGWYIDGEVKADFLGVTYTAPSITLSTNATTVAVLANTGYRFQNGTSFFEPIASFTYANTSLGNATDGVDTITYSNGQSIRAGAGARLGTTFGKPGAVQTQIDLTGKVWDEFGGPSTVTLSDGNPADDVTVSNSIAGVFGEVVGRATVYTADRSASGFVSVGGKFGADMSSIEAKVGVRKSF